MSERPRQKCKRDFVLCPLHKRPVLLWRQLPAVSARCCPFLAKIPITEAARPFVVETQNGLGDPLCVVVLLQSLFQFARDLLEERDLLQEMVLHLGLEVSHADVVEVLDLGQRGAGDDVAAVVDAICLRPVHLALLHVLLALLHLRQGSC